MEKNEMGEITKRSYIYFFSNMYMQHYFRLMTGKFINGKCNQLTNS